MAAYQMGEQYAHSVGVAVWPFCVALVLLSSLLAACVTAFAGAHFLCGYCGAAPGQAGVGKRPSRCMCCRAVRWVGQRSACCVI